MAQGAQSLFEPIIIFVRDEIARPNNGEKKYEKFMTRIRHTFSYQSAKIADCKSMKNKPY